MASPRGNARSPFRIVDVGLRIGRVGVCGILAALLTAAPAITAPGKVLLNDTFESVAVGSKPGAWIPFVDEGNDLVVVETPAVGRRSLKLTRERGTVWKPMVSGNVQGEAESPLCFEFDFFIPSLFAKEGDGLVAVLRGDGNVAVVSVLLGGLGGVAVSRDAEGWLPLGFPLHAGEWGHLRIVTDPIARKEKGAFDVTITQGSEEMTYPNIPFRSAGGRAFPAAWWHSPTLQMAGGTPDKPNVAYVDNVRIATGEGRDAE